jgi:DNA-binding NtrC family response regulator
MKDVKTSKLISHFADKIASEQGNAVKKFSGDAVKLLQEYDWKYS